MKAIFITRPRGAEILQERVYRGQMARRFGAGQVLGTVGSACIYGQEETVKAVLRRR